MVIGGGGGLMAAFHTGVRICKRPFFIQTPPGGEKEKDLVLGSMVISLLKD